MLPPNASQVHQVNSGTERASSNADCFFCRVFTGSALVGIGAMVARGGRHAKIAGAGKNQEPINTMFVVWCRSALIGLALMHCRNKNIYGVCITCTYNVRSLYATRQTPSSALKGHVAY